MIQNTLDKSEELSKKTCFTTLRSAVNRGRHHDTSIARRHNIKNNKRRDNRQMVEDTNFALPLPNEATNSAVC